MWHSNTSVGHRHINIGLINAGFSISNRLYLYDALPISDSIYAEQRSSTKEVIDYEILRNT